MISMSFTRQPLGSIHEPFADHQPQLAGEVAGARLILRLYGEEDYGLRELFYDKVIPFEGQQTYDELRRVYLEKVGSVFAQVTLLRQPNLHLEQTPDGWCVLKLGGAEYPHFDGLVDRLKTAGFDAKPVTGRNGYDAVAIQITEGEEFEAFNHLVPIIITA